MRRVTGLFKKFQGSEGRVRARTAAGILTLAAAVALALGAVPAFGANPTPEVEPVVVAYGGGSGACSATLAGRLPSAAGQELHINNPTSGDYFDSAGNKFVLNVYNSDMSVDISVVPAPGKEVVIYDIVINGGSQNTHYDFDDHVDGNGDAPIGPITNSKTVAAPTGLHAPAKGGSGKYYNLSHINICYDVPGVAIFVCGNQVRRTDTSSSAVFTEAVAITFSNLENTCTTKRASFYIDNSGGTPNVTLNFAGDGTRIAAGKATITKTFSTNGFTTPPSFVPLRYSLTSSGPDTALSWCNLRNRDNAADGTTQFVGLVPDGKYPTNNGVRDDLFMSSDAIACKVAETEDAGGKQVTVVYFEFIDPQFR